eukprot:maker-scaffold_40-snap-gene-2.67-mRNA-1 protein AED:0.07 eAED:0.09 QI:0/0/0.33/0.66/1/1/3/822/313
MEDYTPIIAKIQRFIRHLQNLKICKVPIWQNLVLYKVSSNGRNTCNESQLEQILGFEGGDYGEKGCLFRPCKCSGTIAWVHMECLDTWRNHSSNKKSFYECDQCKFKYKFGRAYGAYDRLLLARLLSYKVTSVFLSLFILFVLMFVLGFVYKIFFPPINTNKLFQLTSSGTAKLRTQHRHSHFLKPKTVTPAPVKAVELTAPTSIDSPPSFWNIFSLNHYLGGSILLGLGSISGWIVSLCNAGLGPRFYFLDYAGIGTRGSNNDLGAVILIVVVIIGLSLALKWIYIKVSVVAERWSRNAAFIVLDVQRKDKD